jgi:hypothetical protein
MPVSCQELAMKIFWFSGTVNDMEWVSKNPDIFGTVGSLISDFTADFFDMGFAQQHIINNVMDRGFTIQV